MNHLSAHELVDAIEERLAADRRVHLDECGTCRQEVSQLSALLNEARVESVPEPSPLYWQQFAARVRNAIAAEPSSSPRRRGWFEWPVLVPLAGLAALLVALGSAVSRDTEMPPVETVVSDAVAQSTDATADADADWELVAALIDGLDLDAAGHDSLSAAPGAADTAVLQLSAAEQEELARLLREELQRSGG